MRKQKNIIIYIYIYVYICVYGYEHLGWWVQDTYPWKNTKSDIWSSKLPLISVYPAAVTKVQHPWFRDKYVIAACCLKGLISKLSTLKISLFIYLKIVKCWFIHHWNDNLFYRKRVDVFQNHGFSGTFSPAPCSCIGFLSRGNSNFWTPSWKPPKVAKKLLLNHAKIEHQIFERYIYICVLYIIYMYIVYYIYYIILY